jgi:uncharacterized membrane protein
MPQKETSGFQTTYTMATDNKQQRPDGEQPQETAVAAAVMNPKSPPSCCQAKAFWGAFTFTQLLSVMVFALSALPYWINFDKRVQDTYNFVDLNWVKTIWLRVHVIACTLNLLLGPIQVLYGLLRKAGNSKVHKYLGYTYTAAMVLCIVTSVPLIRLRYMDDNPEKGGAWVASPLIVLTLYQVVTLFFGIRAIAIQHDKPLHRRMLFRNYCGVFVFVTFRIGIATAGGSLSTIFPTIWMMLTFLATEGIIWKFPNSFDNQKSTLNSTTEDADWQVDTHNCNNIPNERNGMEAI